MKDDIGNYQDLIDDESGRYVLIQTVKGSCELKHCLVYDKQTKTVLLIEDDEVSLRLMTELRRKGVPIVEGLLE